MTTDHGFYLSPKAEDDIIAIAEEGVRQFGSAQARKYHDELFAAIDLIVHNPRIGLPPWGDPFGMLVHARPCGRSRR